MSQKAERKNLAHTYSIVARDENTGEMAVGVQSHWFAVGTMVPWGRSGVGVVATQSFVNPSYGTEGLALMERMSAKKALNELIKSDEGKEYRQVAMLDVDGVVDAYTGKKCINAAHHITGRNFAVQANMMLNSKVVPAMAETFKKNEGQIIEQRVLKVLIAAQEAGGDIRGQKSASLIVVGPERVSQPWNDKKIDLRVDDHTEPLKELERLLEIHTAFVHMNLGDEAVENGDINKALNEYSTAEHLMPENLEMKYWKAVALANNGMLDASLPVFKYVFDRDDNWKKLTRRLPSSGQIRLTDKELLKILDQ